MNYHPRELLGGEGQSYTNTVGSSGSKGHIVKDLNGMSVRWFCIVLFHVAESSNREFLRAVDDYAFIE